MIYNYLTKNNNSYLTIKDLKDNNLFVRLDNICKDINLEYNFVININDLPDELNFYIKLNANLFVIDNDNIWLTERHINYLNYINNKKYNFDKSYLCIFGTNENVNTFCRYINTFIKDENNKVSGWSKFVDN